MHYIRFLKPPTLSPLPKKASGGGASSSSASSSVSRVGLQMTARITIASDLGDSFLSTDLALGACIVGSDERRLERSRVELSWKAGSRQLDLSLVLSEQDAARSPWPLKWPLRLLVHARDERCAPVELAQVLRGCHAVDAGAGAGAVLSVLSEPLERTGASRGSRKLLRSLAVDGPDAMEIWEETGESIARHIWDAGLLLSAYIHSLCYAAQPDPATPLSALLRTILHKPGPLRALELGAGCGIVGITLARCCRRHHPDATILLTDLPEAEDIARHNIRCNNEPSSHHRDPATTTSGTPPRLNYQNLDWSAPLPAELETAQLDLILVADCTYNPDVVPHLVRTLSALLEHNRKAVVLVAMKVRHESEAVFFDLMADAGMLVRDRLVLPLPVLGEESQEIEVYLYSKRYES
ncbi:MAG: hypothetical protein M1818_004384 [Claussenomyces sp. TS43310]|nr:MAG: hypothetical protein M1818_004384 [Claussenomyces sp. TS43310]